MVLQLGLAMIRRPFKASSTSFGFTSGTTNGQSASMRKALELSMTTAPARAACGANSRLTVAPGEKSAIWTPLKESGLSRFTTSSRSRKVKVWPSLRSEARGISSATGKSRSSNTLIISRPTAPVAPAIATLYPLMPLDCRSGQAASSQVRKALPIVGGEGEADSGVIGLLEKRPAAEPGDDDRARSPADQARSFELQIRRAHDAHFALCNAIAEELREDLVAPRFGCGTDQAGFSGSQCLEAGDARDRQPARVAQGLGSRESNAQARERAGAETHRDALNALEIAQRGWQDVARFLVQQFFPDDEVVFEERAAGDRRRGIECEDSHSNHLRMASLRNA